MYENLGLDNTEEEKCRVLCFGSLVSLIQAALGTLYVQILSLFFYPWFPQ